jgi:acyl-CoA thioesterase FadM
MARIHIELPESVHFSTNLSVRISEINYGGHLSNDAVLALAHEARIRFLNHFGFTEFDIGGCGIIMSDAAVMYLSEGFIGNELRIDVSVGNMENAGFELYYRIHNMTTGKDLAHVKTGVISFDYDQRKVRRLPETFKEAITKNANEWN